MIQTNRLTVKVCCSFVFLFVASTMVAAFGQAEAKTWTIKMATYFGTDHAASIALRECFVPMVEKKTDGKVKVNVFDSCQLGGEMEFIEGTRAGTIEMAIFGGLLQNTIPEMKVFELPFVFRNVDHMLKVFQGPFGKKIEEEYAKIGVEMIGAFSQGEVHFANNKRPLRTLADCKGLRVRVWQSDSIINAVKAIGMSATPLPLTETYTALQQGIVDGAPNSILNFKNMGWADQTKYITKMTIMVFPNFYSVNKKWFDKLPADYQRALRESTAASIAYTNKILKAEEAKTEKWYNDKYGIEIIQLSEEEKKPFKDASQDIINSFCAKYPWGKKVLEDIENVK